MSVREEVEAALDHEPVSARDRATATLALTYAAAIDGHEPCEECGCHGCGDLAKLGPALLACLEALLMSPRARAAAKKAVTTSEPAANPLDQLAGRRARKSRAATVDPAVEGPVGS
jgi:hypothetical protein